MGYRVAYSRSPMIHNHWLRSLGLDGVYELVDIAPQDFPGFFRGLAARGYVGGNITTPHKDAAFRLVDRREASAEAIGAVNTVWHEAGGLIGGNTDWLGFLTNVHGQPLFQELEVLSRWCPCHVATLQSLPLRMRPDCRRRIGVMLTPIRRPG